MKKNRKSRKNIRPLWWAILSSIENCQQRFRKDKSVSLNQY